MKRKQVNGAFTLTFAPLAASADCGPYKVLHALRGLTCRVTFAVAGTVLTNDFVIGSIDSHYYVVLHGERSGIQTKIAVAISDIIHIEYL